MRKNTIRKGIVALLSLVSIVAFSACNVHILDCEKGKSAYEIAVDNGFTGTEQEWLASLVGKDGIGIKDVAISYTTDEDGNVYTVFTITYSNDTTETIMTLVPTAATTTEDLTSSLGAGETVLLAADVTTDKNIVMNGGSLDGNGNTLEGSTITERTNCALTTTGGTVTNLNILGAPRGLGTGSSGKYSLAEDLIVDNVYIDKGTYAINVSKGNGYEMIVSNSTLYGWTSYSGLSLATFDACTFGKGQTDWEYLRMYDPTNFVGCTFEEGFKVGVHPDSIENGQGYTITLENCYYGETLITAENFYSLLTIADDEDTVALQTCTVIVDDVTVTIGE